MEKYIDADKLIAEIERLREEYNNSIPVKVSMRKLDTKDFIRMGIVEVLNKVLLCAHDSIIKQEQPEVDLKNEYKEYVDTDPVLSKLVNHYAGMSIARHFYELGLNARKEE